MTEWSLLTRSQMLDRIKLMEDVHELASSKILAQDEQIRELDEHLSSARKIAKKRVSELESFRCTAKMLALFWGLGTAVLVGILLLHIGALQDELDYLREPDSEEQWLDDVTSEGEMPLCGERLCETCSDYIVCYDGGVCSVSGDAHPLTTCSIEHEVK